MKKTNAIMIFATSIVTITTLTVAFWNPISSPVNNETSKENENKPKEKTNYDSKIEIQNIQNAIEWCTQQAVKQGIYLNKGIEDSALNIFQQNKLKKYISFVEEQINLFKTQIDHLSNPSSNQKPIKLSFNDVFGMTREKSELQDLISFFKECETLVNANKVQPKGYLLHGLPGTGKTYLMKALCSEANAHFINLTPSAFDKKYVGEGQQVLNEIWTEAEQFEKTIIFIDEIDGLANRSSNTSTDVSKNIVNDLLNKLDGFKRNDKKIVLMGATNNLEKIDPALRSRFSKEIKIDLIKNEEIEQFLKHVVKPYNISFYTYYHLEKIAERCKNKNYSNRDLVTIIDNAYIKTQKYYNLNKEHNVMLPSDLYEVLDLKQGINKTEEEINNERIECEKTYKEWEHAFLNSVKDEKYNEFNETLIKPRIIPNPLMPVPSIENINKFANQISKIRRIGGMKTW